VMKSHVKKKTKKQASKKVRKVSGIRVITSDNPLMRGPFSELEDHLDETVGMSNGCDLDEPDISPWDDGSESHW